MQLNNLQGGFLLVLPKMKAIIKILKHFRPCSGDWYTHNNNIFKTLKYGTGLVYTVPTTKQKPYPIKANWPK